MAMQDSGLRLKRQWPVTVFFCEAVAKPLDGPARWLELLEKTTCCSPEPGNIWIDLGFACVSPYGIDLMSKRRLD